MADSQTLFDVLSGAAGRPINRTGMEAFVANSQATNGLRSAQTEEALTKAQEAQRQMAAEDQLDTNLGGIFNDPAQRRAAVGILKAHFGNAPQAVEALQGALKLNNQQALSDPNKLGTAEQTAAQQGIQGKVAEFNTAPDNMALLPGQAAPTVVQSPEGKAKTQEQLALARLHGAQADAGGFNPHAGGASVADLPPEQQDALNKAMSEGRLDPARLNSRNAHILGNMALNTPGFNFNGAIRDAALQRNAQFQQKTMTFETLPGVLSHMTELGKKLGYADNRTVGKMQAFMNGEFNDPDYAEYLPVRNDALLSLAAIMRSVGMSDQAHRAETEAAFPSMSPLAFDAYLKGQMSVVKPRLEKVQRVYHMGEQPPAAGAAAGTDAAAADPLGIR